MGRDAGDEGEDGDPCDEGERLMRRGVETIGDEGEDGDPCDEGEG